MSPTRSALPETRATTPGPPERRGRRVHLLVCGERQRGDDAAALLAVDGLTDLPAWVVVRRVGQLDPNDLLAVPEGEACLIVDALVGVPPGTVVRGSLASLLDDAETGRGKRVGRAGGKRVGRAGGKTIGKASGKTADSASGKTIGNAGGKTVALGSSHSIAPREVMGLVRELRGELPAGSYVGVGASSFELGGDVSEPVAAAVPALRKAILREARRLSERDWSSG